jgi:nucleoside-diphosphate-sugar epimerase
MFVEHEDLNGALAQCSDEMRALDNAHVLLTGGTGFVGKWLAAVFMHAVAALHLKARLTILTRHSESFIALNPEIARSHSVAVVHGDVCRPPDGLPLFDAVIHGAGLTNIKDRMVRPKDVLATAFDGTRQILNLASLSGKIPLLFISSGAIYGKQPIDMPHMRENAALGPDTTCPGNAYHEGKRVGEMLCAIEHQSTGVQAKIARLYAFIGPFLPLDSHYAIASFVCDALNGRPIRVLGDASTVRSYLYAADMSAWLWKILLRGEVLRPYNVGSRHGITLRELAALVQSEVRPESPVEIAAASERTAEADVYVPDTTRIVGELGAEESVPLYDAIGRYARFARQVSSGITNRSAGSVNL